VAGLIYAVIVNSDTQVTNLTSAQLQGIYAGTITNWSQVGGTNETITIITRPVDSSIRTIFETYVLKGAAQTASGISLHQFDTNSQVANNVASISGAISYVPLATVLSNNVQPVSIDNVSPDANSVDNGTYPFWSIEHLYSNRVATGLAISFISFCSTHTGAIDLASAEAVPVQDIAQTALSSHMPGPTI
jgi:phosphate transport system substrate-binding protein